MDQKSLARESRAKGRSSTLRPRWLSRMEIPVFRTQYTEGTLTVYGTGTVVVDLIDLPITVRIPCTLRGRSLAWAVSTPQRKELTTMLKKVTQAAGQRQASGPGFTDGGDFPVLLEYLTATQYPTGEKRETATLIVVADPGGWRGCLSDKDNARSLWKASDSVLGLLMALEQAAAEDDPTQWRQQGGASGKGKKRA
jgi:hypothetical protein